MDECTQSDWQSGIAVTTIYVIFVNKFVKTNQENKGLFINYDTTSFDIQSKPVRFIDIQLILVFLTLACPPSLDIVPFAQLEKYVTQLGGEGWGNLYTKAQD